MKYLVLLFLTNVYIAFGQTTVSGTVKDKDGMGMPGVNVLEVGTSNGTASDMDGKYTIKVKAGAKLSFSYIGHKTVTKSVTGSSMDVVLEDDAKLDEVVLTGSRAASRTNVSSALPIDVMSSKDITSSGQATFDKALQYRIPSFNTVQTPVNDATSLLDPYEIRNMGPSRTLILINGKRKNMSSLIYTQTSPGRGETGSDISAIPQDAIERVEILRDGASAQYGSDAIAGVMNIILKKNVDYGAVTLRSGITHEGDGEMFGIALNAGSSTNDGKGFVNYTVDFSKVGLANRPGIVDATAEADPDLGFGADLAFVQNFLKTRPDAGNINGAPETAAAKFLINGGTKYSENTSLYYNAAYVYKKVNSFANYRTPYWRTLAAFPYLADLFAGGVAANYVGYVPTFEGLLNDYNATIGYKTKINDWNVDASLTTGGNSQDYTVSNSHNRSKDSAGNFIYGAASPITFRPGGVGFTHYVGNIDISKNISDKVSVAFGTEFRNENFTIEAGDEASYVGSGADSFQGTRPADAGEFNRYNFGGYADIAVDFTEDFLINGTLRHEQYSDFGDATVWKLSSRYKFLEDKVTLRASLSTGFRAPSLHQIYTQKTQSSFLAGGAIVEQGLVNNVSSAARIEGVEKLKAEKSTNFTVGLGLKPTPKMSITFDYYNIAVDYRIVLSNNILTKADLAFNNTVPPPAPAVKKSASTSFFINALNTRTSGLDFVFTYRDLAVGAGKMNFNVAGNYMLENKVDGNVKKFTSVVNGVTYNQDIFDKTQQALLFTSRPEFKVVGGLDYTLDKWNFALNNTAFGPTSFKNAGMDDNIKVVFETKIVSDLAVTYNMTDKLTISTNFNNFLNVMPKWNFEAENAAGQTLLNNPASIKAQTNLITFNGRYSNVTYDGSHFSQLGAMYNLSLNYKF